MTGRSKKPTLKKPPPVRTTPPDDDASTSGSFNKEASTPIQVISMKTPAKVEGSPQADQPTPHIPRPRLRAISEVTPLPHAQPENLGFLAPPRDPAEVRARRMRDYIVWGSLSLIVASFVALGIWFLAR